MYKIGDTVKIKSLAWYNKKKDKYSGNIYGRLCNSYNDGIFVEGMKSLCGKTFKIQEIIHEESFICYYLNDCGCYFCDWMFEETEQLEFDFNE